MSRPARLAGAALPWLALLAALALAFGAAASLAGVAQNASLRWNEGVDEATALAAQRQAMRGNEDIWPSFWAEGSAKAESPLAEAELPVLWVGGDPAAVWPAGYLAGGPPGAGDEAGVALSQAAAHRLFGGSDIVGCTLRLGGELRTVRGVFRHAEAMVLAGAAAPPGGGWQAAELSGEVQSPERAAELAQSLGLPAPSSVFLGAGFVAAARAAALLAPALLVLTGFGVALAALRRGQRLAALFVAALVLVLAAPLLLGHIPPALLPGRWSDFSHWAGLAQRAAARLRAWFLLRPGLRDAEVKAQFALALAGGLAALAPAAVLCARLLRRRPQCLLRHRLQPIDKTAPPAVQ